jgi:hypothetical protein
VRTVRISAGQVLSCYQIPNFLLGLPLMALAAQRMGGVGQKLRVARFMPKS